MNLKETREFWKVASTFPPDKESVYPAHAAAHCFDEQADSNPHEPSKVLEYGCGGGSDTISLLKRDAYVWAVDVVPENVAMTNRRIAEAGFSGRGQAALLEASDDLPFEDATFDSINCHGVLHHIEEQTMFEVLDEFYRVLKPGGHLYAMLYTEHLFSRCKPQIDGLVAAHGWPVDKAFSYCTDGGGIARAYDIEKVEKSFCDRGGFELVSHVTYNDADFRTYKLRRP